MIKIKRRQFLFISAAGAITAATTGLAAPKNQTVPKLFKSRDGLLELKLEASLTPVNLGGKPAYLMNYNGQVPAPRLEAKAGDTVRIHFTNNLNQASNLHYHGLHISPTGKGDNPFLTVSPQGQLTYEFTIPKNHPSGTFWYHPHYHHYAAEQVFAGLAGLLIIRGELDAIPEIAAAQEEFLVLQDFALDGKGHLQSPAPMDLMQGREGNLITINGQVQPQLSIAKGGLLRLRILNASASRFYRLSLENHPFYLIATDGGAIAEPVQLSELLLTPGERAEVLIRGDRKPGEYRLMNLPYNRRGMGMMAGMSPKTSPVLATLSYKNSGPILPLPKALLPVESLPTPKTVRQIKLSMGHSMGMGGMGGMGHSMGMGEMGGMGMTFLFNGQVFDPERVDIQVQLNSVEDWELINTDADKMDHPFHLHTHSFQVVSRDGKVPPYAAWKDTILVRGGETVRIRIPFRDFSGKSVYHCHILDHQDLGMMGIANISK